MLPLLDPSSVSGLSGSWWVFILGLVTALWSGTGVVRTVQFAFDSVWEIPYHERPGIVQQTLRSLWVLGTIGLGLVLVHARRHGGVALRIEVDQQHLALGSRQGRSEVDGGSGLANSAFLVGDSDDAGHGLVDTVRR